MYEAVHSLSEDEVKPESNSNVRDLSLSECKNDEDSKSFHKEFIKGEEIWIRENFIVPKSVKCESVHSLSMNEVKQEDNSSEEGSSISECRNAVEDSKRFQEQLIEGGEVWKREDFILPEGWNTEPIHSLYVDGVKLEDNSIKEESSFNEGGNNDDSINLQDQLAEEEKIWTREDFILPESCVSLCDVKQLNENTFPDYGYGEIVDENSLASGSDLDNGLEYNFQEGLLELKNHRCHMCEYTTSRKYQLRIHIDGVHLKVKNFKCQMCEFATARRGRLQMHIEAVHLKLKNYKCQQCEYASSFKKDLDAHINRVHLNLKMHKCHMCDFATTRKDNFRDHIRGVHLKLKTHKCQHCEYSTSYKSTLNTHINRVHLKLKNHKCQQCQHTTSKKSDLLIHINRVHLKLKDQKCHMCQYTSSCKSSLTSHINRVHLKLISKNHKCHMCEFSTATKTRLQFHIEAVHLKMKNHKCHMCEYTAARKDRLKIHIEGVHLKVKNHKCHMCEYASTQKNKLKSHINRIHLKLNPNNCQVDNIHLNGNQTKLEV